MTTRNATLDEEFASDTVPTTAILLPILAMLSVLLDIPPMIWHIRNRNLAACFLVFWFMLVNTINTLNAFIWPTDASLLRWNGAIFCDIEVKLIVATYIGATGALICIFYALYHALDTDRTVLSHTKAQKTRKLAWELLACLGAPIFCMIVHALAQDNRYELVTVMGCYPTTDSSWVTGLGLWLLPVAFSIAAAVFGALVMHRTMSYRKNISAILNSNSSSTLKTKRRFARLLIMSLVLIFVLLPVQAYVLIWNVQGGPYLTVYHWNQSKWHDIDLIPTGGEVQFDRWLQAVFGFGIFALFGAGRDAREMYRTALLRIGMGKIWPCLRASRQERIELQTLSTVRTSTA